MIAHMEGYIYKVKGIVSSNGIGTLAVLLGDKN